MNENGDNEFDGELMARAARLPTAVRPARDLWPGIEREIGSSADSAKPARSAWGSVWLQAAAVVLLVGASSVLTYTVVKEGSGPAAQGNGVPLESLTFEPVSGSFGSQYHLGPDYQDARRDLAADLDQELAYLDPAARTAVVENIQTIRKAIDEINRELAKQPDNVLLQELLLETYRDELSLMKKVDGISNAAMRRDDI